MATASASTPRLHVILASQPRLLHEPVRGAVGLGDPLGDLVGLWRIFQLDRDRAVDVEGFDFAQIRLEGDDAAAGWEVAVLFAVAVADVNVDGLSLETAKF